MAKLLYNVSAYEDTAANWAVDTKIYPVNSLLIESDTGILKKGDGINAYADLASVGGKQVITVEDITDFPSTMPPSAHDHAVVDITDFPSTMPPSAHNHAWADITGKPSTFAPEIGTTATKAAAGNHNHAVVADAESGLEAASDIQALAIALSTRIKALEDLAAVE